MLDFKFIRENADAMRRALIARKLENGCVDEFLELDEQRRKILSQQDDLRSKKNAANDEISQIIKEKKDPKGKISAMKAVSDKISSLDPQAKDIAKKIESILINIPNMPHVSVPVGPPQNNKEIRSWGEPNKVDFKPKTHIELGEDLDIIDFKGAAKISGSNFIVYKGAGARLERSLWSFMLDVHTKEHGFTEIFPPVLVNRASMTGTGQLPKMEEDMYRLKDDDLFLIPTAEVPVTNLLRDEILEEDQLPIYYAAYSPCFRREAGSYGKDTKGLIRVHQFDKVEMVKFVRPEGSYQELESLVCCAEKVLQLLGLAYRVVVLATEDLSFASAKTYDLEAYAAGFGKWLEVSSCSNFEDFQARRASIRFREKKTRKIKYVHTLNGSGVALARTMVAILENYQTEEGEVIIPEVLRPYMDGKEKLIKPTS
ncbi:MAG: serine--tRNA ligase [Candidatus Omnitrophota bacterium]